MPEGQLLASARFDRGKSRSTGERFDETGLEEHFPEQAWDGTNLLVHRIIDSYEQVDALGVGRDLGFGFDLERRQQRTQQDFEQIFGATIVERSHSAPIGRARESLREFVLWVREVVSMGGSAEPGPTLISEFAKHFDVWYRRRMSIPFDPTGYVNAPIITVASGVSLALALVGACPKTAPANVKKAAKHLKATAEKARADLADRNRELGSFSEEDSRAIDNEADRAWGGLRLRLTGMAMLPQDTVANAKRAAELDTLLFSDGMGFLKAEYSAQSTSMASHLKQIDDGGLQTDLDRIAGPEFLTAIRAIQPRYEAMVSERLRRDSATGQNLLETTRGLQAAIVNYAAKVIGTIEHDEPETAEAARVALLPIANHRQAQAARGRGASDAVVEPAPDAPKPGT
jgi:hypothetical protein